MKPGDFYHKMKPIDRLCGVACEKYVIHEVYSSPAEVVADLKMMVAQIDALESKLSDSKTSLARLINARFDIETEISAAFKKWQFLYAETKEIK
jgi:predicted metal-dependent phosphoesterase TrpH